MHDRVKYGTKKCRERARQRSDTERERGRASLKTGDGMGNKF